MAAHWALCCFTLTQISKSPDIIGIIVNLLNKACKLRLYNPKAKFLFSFAEDCYGITYHSASDSLFVLNNFRSQVSVYDRDGIFKFEIQTFATPKGICVDLNGNLIVTTSAPKIHRFSPTGEDLGSWPLPDPVDPMGCATDDLGNIYFSDWENNTIGVISVNGDIKYQCNVGDPWGLAIYNNVIFVTSLATNQIKSFDMNGRFQKTEFGGKVFGDITGLRIDSQGNFGVATSWGFSVFDKSGTLLRTFEETLVIDSAIDSRQYIYIACGSSIQVYG